MNRQSVELLKHQLKVKAKEYYGNGQPAQGDKVMDDIEAVEDWEKQGFKGEPPVDLEQLGLKMPVFEGPADEVDRREQLRCEAQAAKARGHLATAVAKWRELLTVDPIDVEAQRELQRHAKTASDQSQRKVLNDLRHKANSEVISDLDEALRLAGELHSVRGIDSSIEQEIERLEESARGKRTELRQDCGVIETYIALGMLKEAIEQLERFLHHGRYEFEDRDGCVIPTWDKLRKCNEEYARFCTQKTNEYLNRADSSLPAYPKSALKILDVAWKEFDRADPAAREKLEQRRIEVGELLDRWEMAQNMVNRATREPNPHARLALLLEARSRYDVLPGIQDLLSLAQRDAVSAFINDIKNICSGARLLLALGAFEDAQQTAMKARELTKSAWGPSDELEAELAKVDQLLDDIAAAVGQRRMVEEATRAIDEYLQEDDFRLAEQTLAFLSEKVHDVPTVKRLEYEIVLRRSAYGVYQVARKRFEEGDFQGVLNLLATPDDGERPYDQYDERLLRLRQQAQARIHYQEGVSIADKDPASAEMSFGLAVLLDDSLKGEVNSRRLDIQERRRRSAEFQRLPESAQVGALESEEYSSLARHIWQTLQQAHDKQQPSEELLALARIVEAVEKYAEIVHTPRAAGRATAPTR